VTASLGTEWDWQIRISGHELNLFYSPTPKDRRSTNFYGGKVQNVELVVSGSRSNRMDEWMPKPAFFSSLHRQRSTHCRAVFTSMTGDFHKKKNIMGQRFTPNTSFQNVRKPGLKEVQGSRAKNPPKKRRRMKLIPGRANKKGYSLIGPGWTQIFSTQVDREPKRNMGGGQSNSGPVFLLRGKTRATMVRFLASEGRPKELL